MLTKSKHFVAPSPDDGFTSLELIVVMLIMLIVISVAGAVLLSLSTTADRTDSMVGDEQAASNAMAQIARDVRSASSLTFPTGAGATDTPNEVELIDNQASGGTTTVLWVYNRSHSTLTREVQVGSVFEPSGSVVSRIANPATSPLFSYFDGKSGISISGESPADISLCTTGVSVDIFVAAPSSTRGVATFEETSEIAVTNQLNTLTAPGDGQCGS